jgi:hypothetical protein
MADSQWPTSGDYNAAIQSPLICFSDPDLKATTPALDRLGMPFVTSGQFAYVFKLNTTNGGKARAVRCFRGFLGDREERYRWIGDHLNKVSAQYFADFEYDPEGILVGGRRFPILVMEWIDGLPLDVYLPKVLGNQDVLKFLADLWLKVLTSIRDGGMAHGDLQHGNIIVDASNMLKLVDLDGMFVPGLAGRQSAEMGHRHYQHPGRTASHFDSRLDNFAGLVIYLGLLALAKAPELWTEFHDENLIFTDRDFKDPNGSRLLGKIKRISAELKNLTEALETACKAAPLDCPSVLDLVSDKPSKLPSWMWKGAGVTVAQTTREVKPVSGGTAPVASPPPSSSASNPNVLASTSSSGSWWQSASATQSSSVPQSPPAPTIPVSPGATPRDMSGPASRHALSYAFIGVFFAWLWFPFLKAIMLGFGAAPVQAGVLAVMSFVVGCFVLGYQRAKNEAQTVQSQPSVQQSVKVVHVPPPSVTIPTPQAPPPTKPTARPTAPTQSTTHQTMFVGSRVRQIYHKPGCRWAGKISTRNRVHLRSESEAKSRGFKPCGVCSP